MLTAKQKALIVKSNPSVGSYLLMQKFAADFDEKVRLLEISFAQKLEAMKQEVERTLFHVKQIQKGDKGNPGSDCIDATPPTREELIALIQPLIPKVKDGRTPTREEIMQLIPTLPDITTIAELVMQRLTLPNTPTAEAIADTVLKKLEDKKLKVKDIKGLEERLIAIGRNIGTIKQRKGGGAMGGGGMGNPTTFEFTGDGSTTEFTLDSRVAANGMAIWTYYQGQWLQPGTHFNVSGTTLTTTFTPENGAIIEGFYIRT